MTNISKSCVGVDISKDYLDVCILPNQDEFRIKNNAIGLKKLLVKLSLHDVEQVVCEATGGYENAMIKALKHAGYNTWQVEPGRIKAFIRSKGTKAKTDKIDARFIAQFAQQNKCPHDKPVLSDDQDQLRCLSERRHHFIKMIKAEKTRLQQQFEFAQKSIKNHIQYMEQEIDKLDKQITAIVENNEVMSKKAAIMLSIPGIGNMTASTLLATMPELGTMTNKQAGSLVGVAPITFHSGKKKEVAYTRGGRVLPRHALYMPALNACRFNDVFKEFYNRLREAGKSAKVAIVAVMRKIIETINAMLRNEARWNPAPLKVVTSVTS
jgi:transposase